jgi:hypothetical protein
MIRLEDGVLYAAEVKEGGGRPVRVLDARRWVSTSSPRLDGFQALPAPGERAPYSAAVGVACLYWSDTGGEADTQTLLDHAWEPLPDRAERAPRTDPTE